MKDFVRNNENVVIPLYIKSGFFFSRERFMIEVGEEGELASDIL
jgi:hypothetical protein